MDVALPKEPPRGGSELHAEGLMPPGAPPAGESTVEDLREGAKGGRMLPKLASEGEEVAGEVELGKIVEVEDA